MVYSLGVEIEPHEAIPPLGIHAPEYRRNRSAAIVAAIRLPVSDAEVLGANIARQRPCTDDAIAPKN